MPVKKSLAKPKKVKASKPKKVKESKSVRKKLGVPYKTLKRFHPIIRQLANSRNKKARNNIINSLPRSGIDSVCECLYNALFSKNLDKRSLNLLRKLPLTKKNNIRYLALAPRLKQIEKKRGVLRQSGGSIAAVLASVLPLLTSLF